MRRAAGAMALLLATTACSATLAAQEPSGTTRTYFIAADQVDWDYAPSGMNQVTGRPFGEEENTHLAQDKDRIGRVYRKSLFREYVDASFGELKPRSPAWEHLGMLGPAIRAEVGDTIRVVFRNNTPFPASLHPHGVRYAKDSEGAPYDDGTEGADKADDAVAAGGTHTYVWEVPERAGPGPDDPSSVMWMYHSHASEIAGEVPDTYAGLMGPIIVTRRGMAHADGSPKDVDREFVAVFMVMDENSSPWIDKNIATFAGRPPTVKKEDEDFAESNLMHAINGYMWGNQPGLAMAAGERVRWYLMGMGTEVDLHTGHWHGNTVTVGGMRTDVISMLPATMVVADMVPDARGTWLFHCHVADHVLAGMLSKYRVS